MTLPASSARAERARARVPAVFIDLFEVMGDRRSAGIDIALPIDDGLYPAFRSRVRQRRQCRR